MVFDQRLAARVRALLSEEPGYAERQMFGGLAFMLQGNMCCGVVGDDLMVRVGREAHEGTLTKPYARPMDFTGRPMRGMVYVEAAGLKTKAQLRRWIGRGVDFASGLPEK